MATNKNQRYQTSNSASVFGLKESHNTLVDNVALLNFTNLAKNTAFNRMDGSNVLYDWTPSLLTGTYDNTNLWYTGTFGNQGYLKQNINTDTFKQLKPNTIYSVVLYSSATATGMVLEVTSTLNYQVYDINDTTQTQSASAAIEVSGTNIVKHMISFRTNATAVSGDIILKIRNSTTVSKTCYLQAISVYEGLVEIGGIPSKFELLPQASITSGTPYSTIIFNESGIAVSAAQRAQSADKLYNVGGAVEALINDAATATSAVWTSNKINSLLTSLTNVVNNLVPVGTVVAYPVSHSLPTGWIVCNGGTLPKTTAPVLYSILVNTYGGDANNVGLPDFRNRYLKGSSAGGTYGSSSTITGNALIQVRNSWGVPETNGAYINIPTNSWSSYIYTGGETGSDLGLSFLNSGTGSSGSIDVDHADVLYIIKYA